MEETVSTKLALILQEQKHQSVDITEIKENMKGNLVTRAEFVPVRNVAYGAVGVMFLTFMGLIAAVLSK